ncbi:hypothetical protein [Spirosoma endbachense]|uniref:Uncharacterized protein n=1 Tax=Spirosoma endbachense TaxID=2666025 RepID=A0A6P1VXR6_9BACT|nr:hypothetical protein [Spirosoma endbachense]QHV97991.1 hypothetical protein GJR95_24575 [Spirosoma endbachense]
MRSLSASLHGSNWFTTGDLPAGIQFLGRLLAEPTLIRLTRAYEQETLRRIPQKRFTAAGQ